jgi:4-amino-4-deoxy-L-arabinose transferase-like glycosyltransferase
VSRWLVVAVLLGLAAVVRVSAMFYHHISGDDATVGLMASHILAGENLPVFFYRQAFIGSLNGLHLVPTLFLFGPSVPFLPLNAIAWSLLFPLLLYVLGRRVFDEASARLTLVLAAVPPFCLTYWSGVQGHFETNTFGTILCLLALPILAGCPEPRRSRLMVCLGFVAGVAFWTSAKVVVVLGPIVLLLLLRDPRIPFRRAAWLAGVAFLVGSLPAWLYYATHRDPGQGNLGSAQRFLTVDLDHTWAWLGQFLVDVPPLLIATYYWNPNTPVRLTALILCIGVYLGAILLIGMETLRARRRTLPARRVWGFWLLLLTLVATYAALYFSEFGRVGEHARARYVLPAYIPLLLVVGAAIVRLSRSSRLLAGAVLAFLLAMNVWTNLAFLWPFNPDERARRVQEIANREALVRRLRAFAGDAVLTDNPYESVIWQFLVPGTLISALATEIYYPSAVRADASERVAILDSGQVPGIETQLRALGATATAERVGTWWLYDDVRVQRRQYRLVPRTGWRTHGEPDAPPAAADGDLGTAWPERRLDASERGRLVLDLGLPRAVARVVFWPTALTDVLVPLEIAGSGDAVTWERLGVAPEHVGSPAFVAGERVTFRPRNGWLELVVSPRSIRYLRIQPVAPGPVGVGMVGELFVYEALDGPASDGVDLDRLLAVLRARGVTRLLADPVVSARVALATRGAVETLPANSLLNNHGLSPPMHLFARLRLRESDAALVPVEDAGELRERLDSAGVGFVSEPVGSGVLFQPVGPLPVSVRCRATDWRLRAEVPDADGRGARYVVEGRLPDSARIAAIRLEHPRVSARHAAVVRVEVSEDDRAWRAVDGARSNPELAWAGRTLFAFSGGATEVRLGGASARAVRVGISLPYRGEKAITSMCVRGQA